MENNSARYPRQLTFFVENVTPHCHETTLANGGFDYLENGDCILVGRPEKLKENFPTVYITIRFN